MRASVSPFGLRQRKLSPVRILYVAKLAFPWQVTAVESGRTRRTR